MAKLYIVGLGPGKPEGMTLEARAALDASDLLCGYGAYLALLAPLYRSNSVWLVMLPSVLYVLMHRKELKEFTNLRAVVWTEIVLGVMLAYLMAMAKLNGNPVSAFGYFVYWMAGVIPFALACWICLRKKGLGFA